MNYYESTDTSRGHIAMRWFLRNEGNFVARVFDEGLNG